MEKHSAYTPPQMLTKYPNGEYRFVGYDIKIGDEVYCEQSGGKVLEKFVKKVVESHVSGGNFDKEKYTVPTSYRLICE